MAAERQAAALRALLQIEKEAREAESVEQLAFVMVNRTLRLLPYVLAVHWRGPERGERIEAVSGVAVLERASPFVDWFTKAVRAAARHGEARRCRVLDAEDLPADLREDWREWCPPSVLWMPLAGRGGPLGGLWLAREEPWRSEEVALAEHLAGTFGHALAALRGGGRRLAFPAWRRRAWAAAAIAAVALAMLAPVELSVLAPATVVDARPLVVSAPMDGVVRTVEVAPDSLVEAGQVLFTLDDRAVRSRLELAAAALAAAEADHLRSQQLAFADPMQKARLPVIEAQLRQHRLEVAHATDLLERTVVRAEAAGLAVFSDPNDWIGRPVAVGERVMTIADPERAEAEIWLAVDDLIPLPPGAQVRLFLNTDPLAPLPATLYRASYEAAPRDDGTPAYRLRARFADGIALPRIGQQATARISGGRTILFHYLFRRPLAALRRALPF